MLSQRRVKEFVELVGFHLAEGRFEHAQRVIDWAQRECEATGDDIDMPVWELGLREAVETALTSRGIETVRDFARFSRAEVLRWPGFGQLTYDDIVREIAKRGIVIKKRRTANAT